MPSIGGMPYEGECYTQPDGSCISDGPCIHTPAQDPASVRMHEERLDRLEEKFAERQHGPDCERACQEEAVLAEVAQKYGDQIIARPVWESGIPLFPTPGEIADLMEPVIRVVKNQYGTTVRQQVPAGDEEFRQQAASYAAMNEALARESREQYVAFDGSSFRLFDQATISAVQAENISSQAKHGLNRTNMSPITSNGQKLANLGEEYGEVCRALTYDNMPGTEGTDDDWEAWKDHLVKELLQLANLALQWAQLADTDRKAVIRCR